MGKFFITERERKYRRDYEAFISSLPESERAQFEEKGVARPLGEGKQTKARPVPTGSGEAGDFAKDIGGFAEEIGRDVGHGAADVPRDVVALGLTPAQGAAVWAWYEARLTEEIAQMHATVLGRTAAWLIQVKPKDMALEVKALAFVAHLNVVAALGTEADVAREHGVTRSAVSKRVSRLRDELGYCVTGVARSEANRDACASAQADGHWRKKLTWKK